MSGAVHGKAQVRLNDQEWAGIRRACEKTLPSGAKVWLFGSRVHPEKRGGDIDLLVYVPHLPSETALDLQLRLKLGLEDALGERKTDIVLTPTINHTAEPFVRLALQDAVLVWP